ncbi:TadE/TadG family type IV pilus assembly protein [Hyalangium gracile]|uniref:TadE/TadG family type IV pilus assembly protein n=1 Tax=Hyalangium gracile TaxID=394092 RepID=UPI001CCFE071|nr:TadE family protein [Hyalangium gracile]
MVSQRSRSKESGQAAVEAALTLPLTVFLVLGTLQLFMMLQGRIMAEYAAFQAVRAGSRNHGDCVPMMHAALAGLLPNVVSYMGGGGGQPGQKLAQAWSQRIGSPDNPDPKYQSGIDGNHTGPIFWMARERPLTGDVSGQEDAAFDDPRDLSGDPNNGGLRLEVRLVYWYALKIPFADWVISRMILAYFGLQDYNYANPLMLAERNAGWTAAGSPPTLDSLIRNELVSRVMSGEYVFPIHATYGMRMMTPAKSVHFSTQNCPGTPNGL